MHKRAVIVTGAIAAAVLIGSGLTSLSAAASGTFTVTNVADGGSGSLRQAIDNANASGGGTISFAIGSGQQTIVPNSPLPPILKPTTVDGQTQPGFNGSPLITISGYNAGAGAQGIYVTQQGSGSLIRDLVINRFNGQGIFIDTSNVTIQGNWIGTTSNGLGAAGNGNDGIGVFSGINIATAARNTIGGTAAGQGNVVSGNTYNGIGITAQNGGNADHNVVEGNIIGLNALGTAAVSNGGDGILVNNPVGYGNVGFTTIGGTTGVTPGGACSGACNNIAGNRANGIGLWHGGVYQSTVQGNMVGLNHAGTAGIGNANIGIELNESPNNVVGGTTPAERNVFSANTGAGVFFTGAGATGNTVEGNYIGTNPAGNAAIGNGSFGVSFGASPGDVGPHNENLGGTSGTTPGGACTGACNLISGNHGDAVFILGSESYQNTIQGNYIGSNAAGNGVLGNSGDGIGIQDAVNTQIGGSSPNARNVIASNGANGVILGGSATGNAVQGNYIGMLANGASAGNAGDGIAVGGGQYNWWSGNDIAYNVTFGIDLNDDHGPNPNHTGNGDGESNHLQNYPRVFAANTVNGVTRIGGEFSSTPNGNFTIDFFASDNCQAGPPRDYGEGQTFLGSTPVKTDQFGNITFAFTSPVGVAGNRYITAVATHNAGSYNESSEFSQCILVNVSKPALVTNTSAGWLMKVGLRPGPADFSFGYGFPAYDLMCAWDPTQPGVKLPVIFSGGTWYLHQNFTTGAAEKVISYGPANAYPVCGDWNNDGVDTIGVVTPSMQWDLRNSNSSGPPDIPVFTYGGQGTIPVVGDWDGNGTDTVGVVAPGNVWNLRNANSSGAANYSFQYGGPGTKPVVGDWDGSGHDGVGVVSPDGTWSLRAPLSSGPASTTFNFGTGGGNPVLW